MRYFGGLIALALTCMTGCHQIGSTPWPPTLLTAKPANSSAFISFFPPLFSGQSSVSTYVVQCQNSEETLSTRGDASPLTVSGLTNGAAYNCVVNASNAAGMSTNSNALSVTPQTDSANSLASGYRNAAWAKGMSITFPTECSMTVWPSARPDHPVDAYYLSPVLTNQKLGNNNALLLTKISAIALEVVPLQDLGAQAPMQFNICPTKAQTPTAVNAGSIGVLISGSVLYGAAEIEGHRATTLNDNAFHTFRSREGQTITASFIDQCNGHPTPNNAGNSYHYHALSECVTSKVDHESGPSHLIGVALDGFPIYGDKDLSGKTIRPDLLDACNGINSPTPEFPQGVYHYVLPSNVTQHNASMRCYSGNLSRKALAIANASGFCYAPRTESIKNFAEKMDMRGR
jgi:hypothetical protein